MVRFNSIFAIFTLLAVDLIRGDDSAQEYIIQFDPDDRSDFDSNVSSVTDTFVGRSEENEVTQTFDEVFYGMSAHLDDETLEKVKGLHNVLDVVPVTPMRAFTTQTNSPWGLARISQRQKLGDAPYSYRYSSSGGEGVTVFVLDTGINIKHVEFEGRASWGYSSIKESTNDDLQGHGTHCAGTIAGKTFGVAKKARVVAVKVLNDQGGGSDSTVIAGLNWVIKNAKDLQKTVLSMSLGGDGSDVLDKAIKEAISKGALIIAAAGNENQDACNCSPGRVKEVITVGATDIADKKPRFSNYGKCVDILAPGVEINSTYIGSTTSTKALSGTSMACPHIAGLSACILSEDNKVDDVRNILTTLGTNKAVTGFNNDTVNILAFNGYADKKK